MGKKLLPPQQTQIYSKIKTTFLIYPRAVINGKSVGVQVSRCGRNSKRFGKLNWEDLFIEPIKIAQGLSFLQPSNTLQYMRYLKTVEPAVFVFQKEQSQSA